MPFLYFSLRKSVQLQGASFTIGKDLSCDLTLTGRDILPRHLILQARGDRWQAATLSPRAVVFINDQPLDTIVILNDGDRIRVGEYTLIWREMERPNLAPAPAPWRGLLAILAAILLMLGLLFLWFYISVMM